MLIASGRRSLRGVAAGIGLLIAMQATPLGAMGPAGSGPVQRLQGTVEQVAIPVTDLASRATEVALADGKLDEAVRAVSTGLTPFHMVGIRTRIPPGAEIRMRVHSPRGWQSWFTLETDSDGGPDPAEANPATASEPVWTGEADGYELALPLGTRSAKVFLVRDSVVTSQRDTDAVATAATGGAATPTPGAPPTYGRHVWSARQPASSPIQMSSVRVVFVHHTVNSNTYTAADVPAILRGIQAYHMDVNGWNDIAYNFVVDRFGRIWEGRGGLYRNVLGGHTGGFNTRSMGVAVLGDFSRVHPSAASVSAVARIAGWKLGRNNQNPRGTATLTAAGHPNSKYAAGQSVAFNAISGHRDASYTSCPGLLYNYLSKIRQEAVGWAIAAGQPFGVVDEVRMHPGGAFVRGWTLDPNSDVSLVVHVYANGTYVGGGLADRSRPDVSQAYPEWSANPHGFELSLRLPAGPHNVCVYALNVGYGANRSVGCRRVLAANAPIGALDSLVRGPTGFRAVGWAIDPDVTSAIAVHATMDGVTVGGATANRHRPDVAGAYRSYGPAHGYVIEGIRAPQGRHGLCAVGLNIGPGRNSNLRCRSLTIDNSPFGVVDSVSRTGGSLRLRGWTIEPEDDHPVVLHVYVDGNYAGGGTTSVLRPDVAAVYPLYGARKGFDVAVPTGSGSRSVCVYAINRHEGTHRQLGCRTV